MVKRIIRYVFSKLKGRDKTLDIKINCNSEWYGNTYGGFYANPDLITEKSTVYSVGIGEDISFDEKMIEIHDCNIYAFDPTPKSIEWVKKRDLPDNFHFYQYGLSNKSGTVDFYLPKNTEYVSGSIHVQQAVDINRKVPVLMKTIQDITSELGHTEIDVLKIDIEGSEYDVIDDIINLGIPIKQLLVEFHGRLFENGHRKTREAVKKLEKAGFLIFAVSGSKEEVSFINQNYM